MLNKIKILSNTLFFNVKLLMESCKNLSSNKYSCLKFSKNTEAFMKNRELIEAARNDKMLIKLEGDFYSGEVSSALLAENGKIYTGICIDLPCGLGFCAEASAIASMLKDGISKIESIVAIRDEGKIITPCGRCREMIVQLNSKNFDTEIILSEDSTISLKDLLPSHWLF